VHSGYYVCDIEEMDMDKRRDKDIDSIFLKIPFLLGLSDVEKIELKKHIVIRDFRRNEIILNEDDTLNFLYLIISGELKVVQKSTEGQEHILAIHEKGDFFGEMGLLDGKTTPAAVVALKNGRIGLIPREAFFQIIMTNRMVKDQIIGILCMRLRHAWLQIRAMSFESAEHRIRFTLQELGGKFGVHDNRGIMIDLDVTHQNIASLSMTSRETVTRFLRKAAKDDEIEILPGKRIILKDFSFQ
jgi:CRP/FNR family transcriptional regulator, cyclic AMP receptor protein